MAKLMVPSSISHVSRLQQAYVARPSPIRPWAGLETDLLNPSRLESLLNFSQSATRIPGVLEAVKRTLATHAAAYAGHSLHQDPAQFDGLWTIAEFALLVGPAAGALTHALGPRGQQLSPSRP